MFFIEHITVQELPYFSPRPCSFLGRECQSSRIVSHMPEIKQVGNWLGELLSSSAGSFSSFNIPFPASFKLKKYQSTDLYYFLTSD